jgi:hypothetical protein
MPFHDFNRRYRSTFLAPFVSYSDPTPKLTSRTTNVKITRVVEFTTTERPFGPVSKKCWRSEVESSTTETFE